MTTRQDWHFIIMCFIIFKLIRNTILVDNWEFRNDINIYYTGIWGIYDDDDDDDHYRNNIIER